MATKNAGIRGTTSRTAPRFAVELAELFGNLARALFDPYRPELHYMRGRGPQWRAKHARARIPVRINR